jgi:hypothetical protein
LCAVPTTLPRVSSGGINSEIKSNLPDMAQLLAYDPEHVSNYELGFKSQFMNANVQLMADVLYCSACEALASGAAEECLQI